MKQIQLVVREETRTWGFHITRPHFLLIYNHLSWFFSVPFNPGSKILVTPELYPVSSLVKNRGILVLETDLPGFNLVCKNYGYLVLQNNQGYQGINRL